MNPPFAQPFELPPPSRSGWAETIYGFIWSLTRRHQFGICTVAIGVAALTVAPIELQKRIVNVALENDDLPMLFWLGGLFLAAILAMQAAKFLLGIYQNWISQSVIVATRRDLFDNLSEREVQDGGQAVSVLERETEEVGQFAGTGLSDLVADGGKLVFAIGYMLFVDPRIALVALVFFLPQVVLAPYLQKKLNHFVRVRTDLLRTMSDQITGDVAVDECAEDFDATSREVFDNQAKSTAVKFALKAFVNLMNSLAPLSVLVFGGWLYIQGSTDIGTILAFVTAFERMAGPLRALVSYYRVASLRNEQYLKITGWDTQR